MTEISWFSIPLLLLTTLAQHESAVVLWFRLLQPHFQHWTGAALLTLGLVSFIDLLWLLSLFYVFRKSFHRIAQVEWIRGVIVFLKSRSWFHKIEPYFSKTQETHEISDTDSRFRRFVKNSGGLGILICGSLPGPGLKEIGIVMALTPKYKDRGFLLMFLGGLIKTIMTLIVYGGLDKAFQQLLR